MAPRCKVHGFAYNEYNRLIAVLGRAIRQGARVYFLGKYNFML